MAPLSRKFRLDIAASLAVAVLLVAVVALIGHATGKLGLEDGMAISTGCSLVMIAIAILLKV